MSVSARLPDVAHDSAHAARRLDWVGMDGIALPLGLADGLRVAARADVAVSLDDEQKRGIHMSRLYLRLQEMLPDATLRAAELDALMASLIESQRGLAQHARLRLAWDHLLLRPALVSDNHGWKRYPVHLELEHDGSTLHAWLQLEVEYSSTCPASAALSRQVNAEAFAERFGSDMVDPEAVRAWLASAEGQAATPHAQRSVARVRVELLPGFGEVPVKALADALEAALATPVQTAVKREDEQAFARANAENLMFCEDAARRVAQALSGLSWVRGWQARVAHLESLHAHDAVAEVSGRN
ncbi:GTP cyclohydrolase FolE2 [Luteimonas sp. e5]